MQCVGRRQKCEGNLWKDSQNTKVLKQRNNSNNTCTCNVETNKNKPKCIAEKCLYHPLFSSAAAAKILVSITYVFLIADRLPHQRPGVSNQVLMRKHYLLLFSLRQVFFSHSQGSSPRAGWREFDGRSCGITDSSNIGLATKARYSGHA